MPDDQNTNQNPIPEENTLPVSPFSSAEGYGRTQQEPIPPAHEALGGQRGLASENTGISETAEVPPVAPEALRDDFEVKSNDIPPSNSNLTEPENEQKTEEIQAENEANTEPISGPFSKTIENIGEIQSELEKPSENNILVEQILSDATSTSSIPTAQIPVNEPFNEVHDEPLKPKTQPDPEISKPEPEKQKIEPEPAREEIKITEPNPVIIPKNNLAKELLAKARDAIQFRKRKKLDKIMALFLQKSKITNDEVEKFLHISDATATRYLSQLEKEGKIKQNGKTGHAVSYSRI
jgi:hypothetical protein